MMSKSHPVHPRQTGTIPTMAPRASAFSGGNVVELPDTGSAPVNPKPDDAEILKAIGELSRKLSVLSKNQSVLADRLRHLEGLISNNSSNVVNGFVYMRWLMWAVAYWTLNEDDDTWGRNVPKMPHWH
jgi:hypothetical protein